MEVSRSGYYEWKTRPESATAKRRELLKVKIKALFEANNKEYGYRCMHQALVRGGEECSHQHDSGDCSLRSDSAAGVLGSEPPRHQKRSPGSSHASPVTRRDQVKATKAHPARSARSYLPPIAGHTRLVAVRQPPDRLLRARSRPAPRLRRPRVQAMGQRRPAPTPRSGARLRARRLEPAQWLLPRQDPPGAGHLGTLPPCPPRAAQATPAPRRPGHRPHGQRPVRPA
jgi:hypothetical protein